MIYTNGTATPLTYYYVLNLQGDVVGLVNANGVSKAEYTYNAWGEVLSATGAMAAINPLRYRGYYHDAETGFYYLQSRYYDPVLHRFINADSLASTGQGILGANMFAYCNNNPINIADDTGHWGAHISDKDGNGIPDYLEKRWYHQTKRFKKKAAMEGENLRDVTTEVDSALAYACAEGAMSLGGTVLNGPMSRACSYIQFYNMVNHDERWDIKREQRWLDTIGTSFPGEGVYVMYHDEAMTPEDIGNYTYGRIGRCFGFRKEVLIFGSYYAAGFPKNGIDLWNELIDWHYILKGYYSQ